jgi:hypothetical protein
MTWFLDEATPDELEEWAEPEVADDGHADLGFAEDTEAALFPVTPQAVGLADRFGVPPFSVLQRYAGPWKDRRNRWLGLGIRSELGRDGKLLSVGMNMLTAINDGTSVFDPVLCELVYRWFSAPGDRVLDPFAGGSVRGVVAGNLGRHYTGVDLRDVQVAANREQAHLAPVTPEWVTGDAAHLPTLLPPSVRADLVFSCPPYFDLERYSDDPADLSTMTWPEFQRVHATVIRAAADRLEDNRFACWVISEVRGPDGNYRGLVPHTIRAFAEAGLHYYGEGIIADPLGSAPQRAAQQFLAARKLVRVHQNLLVFVKGSGKEASRRLGAA